jgi:hypothetical protein
VYGSHSNIKRSVLTIRRRKAERHAVRRQNFLKRTASTAGKFDYWFWQLYSSWNDQLDTADLNDPAPPVTPRRALAPFNRDGPPAPRRLRVLDRFSFAALKSPTRPGLTATEFRQLFARCGHCGLVKASDVFVSHKCVDVIDLTTDEADENWAWRCYDVLVVYPNLVFKISLSSDKLYTALHVKWPTQISFDRKTQVRPVLLTCLLIR